MSEQGFHSVNYQDISITNAKSVYYTLMEWASDEAHIQKKTSVEKAQIKSVVEELKQVKSPYYERLVNDGWLHTYEK